MDKEQSLLVMYGRILGLTPEEMKDVTLAAQDATEDFGSAPPEACIIAASGGYDPKILWLGAVVYGYIVATCAIVDREAGDVPQ